MIDPRSLPGEARTTVIIDANIPVSAWADSWLSEQGGTQVVYTLDPDPTFPAVEHCTELLSRDPESRIVVIGGGAVLDTVRLGRLLLWGGDEVRIPVMRGRQGYVFLEDVAMGGSLLAVPTTLGTGAERSRVACVLVDGRRRLVLSPALRSDGCAYDPRWYGSLPSDMLRASALEVVLRVLGPFIMSDACEPTDRLAVEAIQEVLELWPQVWRRSPAALLRLAELSGRTHDSERTYGRHTFSTPLWYLANELSGMCRISKMDAHALLLPTCLHRVCDVGGPWGSAERLSELLDRVAAQRTGRGSDDHLRALHLLNPILWTPPQPVVDTRKLSFECVRQWGGGLPALGSLSCDEIEAFFHDALYAEGTAQ